MFLVETTHSNQKPTNGTKDVTKNDKQAVDCFIWIVGKEAFSREKRCIGGVLQYTVPTKHCMLYSLCVGSAAIAITGIEFDVSAMNCVLDCWTRYAWSNAAILKRWRSMSILFHTNEQKKRTNGTVSYFAEWNYRCGSDWNTNTFVL